MTAEQKQGQGPIHPVLRPEPNEPKWRPADKAPLPYGGERRHVEPGSPSTWSSSDAVLGRQTGHARARTGKE